MNTEHLKAYKERLLALRVQLRDDVEQMADPIFEKPLVQATGDLSVMPSHMADIGNDNFEREFTLRLIEAKDQTFDQIEAALQRMEDGVYGACEECQGKIPSSRLDAIPYAAFGVKCASRLAH